MFCMQRKILSCFRDEIRKLKSVMLYAKLFFSSFFEHNGGYSTFKSAHSLEYTEKKKKIHQP